MRGVLIGYRTIPPRLTQGMAHGISFRQPCVFLPVHDRSRRPPLDADQGYSVQTSGHSWPSIHSCADWIVRRGSSRAFALDEVVCPIPT